MIAKFFLFFRLEFYLLLPIMIYGSVTNQRERWAKKLCLFYTMSFLTYPCKYSCLLFYALWGKYEKQYRLAIEQMVYFFFGKK